jgi:hypothetical protein
MGGFVTRLTGNFYKTIENKIELKKQNQIKKKQNPIQTSIRKKSKKNKTQSKPQFKKKQQKCQKKHKAKPNPNLN